MAFRQVDVYLPEGFEGEADLSDDVHLLGQWEIETEQHGRLIRVLLETESTESFLDKLQEQLGPAASYRIVLLPVEATLPQPDDPDPDDDGERRERLSRDELYADIVESIRITKVFYALVLLSALVAAGGMLRDNVAVVIGAMVIAPLIGPNMALALGTTLGDSELLRRAMKANLLGLMLAMGIATVLGLVLTVDPSVPELLSRTRVTFGDMALALAAGVAGALSYTRGVSSALIGVMVAVALLPPVVALGMLLGSGHWVLAYGAGILTVTNVAAINLAGVVTFLLQGIRPMLWYEERRAKKATRLAIGLWVMLLALLVVAIALAPKNLVP